ncbi:MAG: hypothetical protein HOP21_12805 [Methylotenera sp.]|nr:hypothetical protein [Methylotenera sp.]
MEADDRVIEVALIEEIDGELTGKSFNHLINPDGKPMTEAAIDVTDYSDNFLKQFPQFYEIADALLKFIKDAELVCWNVNYDLSNLNRELYNLGKPEILSSNDAIATDVRTKIRKNHPHLSTLRHHLYLHFDVMVNHKSMSWVQRNCLRMIILYQKLN